MIISLFRVPSSLKVRISGTVAVPCVYVFIFSDEGAASFGGDFGRS